MSDVSTSSISQSSARSPAASGRARPRAIVIEANEVPPRIFRRFAEVKPSSNIARLLKESRVMTTEANDVPIESLYPSQTWASLNTGVPYEKHLVHWYNDPKPLEYPLYWKTLVSSGYSVGLVNSLHASPPEELVENDGIKFLIPEVFATSSLTKPSKYQTFQEFNQEQANENRRVTSISLSLREIRIGLGLLSLGVKVGTMFNIAKTVIQVAAKRVTKERLRDVQFMLIADMFVKLLRKNDVDLAMFFTNHVAGNMHRYWYALFPDDYLGDAYDDDWIGRHSDEIFYALNLFDSFIGQMMGYCRSTDRVLIINSSMGQYANPVLDTSTGTQYIVDDVDRFLSAVGVRQGGYEVHSAMEPQYTLEFKEVHEAQKAFQALKENSTEEVMTLPTLNGNVLTISVGVDSSKDTFNLFDGVKTPSDLGLKSVTITDHHSGHHHPDGTLIIYNGSSTNSDSSRVDYLEFAPSVLEFFGIPCPEYMVEPGFKI